MNATVTTDPIKPFSRHESDVTCTRPANQSTDARPGQCVFFSTVQYLADDPNTYTVAWSGNQSNNVRSVYCIIIHGKEIHLSDQHQDAQLRNHFPGAT